jgi:hypothetical protein
MGLPRQPAVPRHTWDFDTRRFGGNTTCYEIRTRYQGQEELFIIDMGTGMAGLGRKLLQEFFDRKVDKIGPGFSSPISIWTTPFGMGFFAPLFMPGHEVHFYTLEMPAPLPTSTGKLAGLYDGIQFPRHLDQMPSIGGGLGSESAFHDVRFWDVLEFDTARVSVVELNHPQGCAGWRFEERASDGSYSGAVLAVPRTPSITKGSIPASRNWAATRTC